MTELQQVSEGGSNTQKMFPQENASDHIHLTPDYMNQGDRSLLRHIRTGQVVADQPAELAEDHSSRQVKKPVPKAVPKAAPGKTPELSPCPISPEYDQIMSRAYHNMYEPQLLGDFSVVRNKYNCQIKNVDDAVRFAGKALEATGDPYNSVFDKKQSDDRSKESQGVWHGFGFNFADKASVTGVAGLPSPLKVVGTIAGSPVEKSGIKAGDFVLAVDGVSLTGKSFDDAFALVKSDAAKKFTISRDGKPFDVDIAPADVDTPAVTDKMLPNNIAYINVSTFGQSDTAQELQKSLEKNLGADGYILDLRHNPGGFFDEAIKAASLFVKDGTVVSVRQRVTGSDVKPGGKEPPPDFENTSYVLDGTNLNKITVDEATSAKASSSSTRLPDLVDKPTVILVDEESASSSEVFTGALKDHGDATVIGTKTYGKGIGQMNYYNMPGGSTLRVTNFRYFTPNGFWPGDAHNNRIGITPDQIVPNPAAKERGTDKDLQLKAAVDEINRKLGR